jgi:hypothetical protein
MAQHNIDIDFVSLDNIAKFRFIKARIQALRQDIEYYTNDFDDEEIVNLGLLQLLDSIGRTTVQEARQLNNEQDFVERFGPGNTSFNIIFDKFTEFFRRLIINSDANYFDYLFDDIDEVDPNVENEDIVEPPRVRSSKRVRGQQGDFPEGIKRRPGVNMITQGRVSDQALGPIVNGQAITVDEARAIVQRIPDRNGRHLDLFNAPLTDEQYQEIVSFINKLKGGKKTRKGRKNRGKGSKKTRKGRKKTGKYYIQKK